VKRAKDTSTRALGAILLASIAAGFALVDQSRGEGDPQPAPAASIQQLPPRIEALFPALRKPLDSTEARQLPAIAQVMSILASKPEPDTGGANSALARRISLAGEDAEYLVPGNEVLCMVSIMGEHVTGAGCAPASSVETVGTTSLTVLPAGYELTGILPEGTLDVTITDASGKTTTVSANANHAFRLFSTEPLARLEYDLPGGKRHVGSLALPPAPHVSPADG
jgi:hypothetical protein